MMQHVRSHALGPRMQVERYRLEQNGLELLVLVDREAPVVSYQTWFKVGSRVEREGKTGIAHLFEHLMFNETEGLPPGELDRRLEEAGVETNAATYLDWTFYMQNLPREALALVVDLESERMHRLVLQERQLESEREVVKNERRQTVEDDVDGTVAELLFANAFQVHGYRFPTIGSMADIENLGLDDCRSFYRTYYAPNNATIVVVGDVEPSELLQLVESRYGALPAATIPPEAERPEPPQNEERRIERRMPAEGARLAVGYKSPAMADADHPPLVLLNEILFGGRSGRMYRALVDGAEIATEVQGMVGSFRDPSLWEMNASGRPDVLPGQLLAALDLEIERLRAEPASARELERARARVELGSLLGLETAGGKAEQIGFAETVLGDPAAVLDRLEDFRRVTREDLQRVAQRYLDARARTVVLVEPEDGFDEDDGDGDGDPDGDGDGDGET
jgi:zinc protease